MTGWIAAVTASLYLFTYGALHADSVKTEPSLDPPKITQPAPNIRIPSPPPGSIPPFSHSYKTEPDKKSKTPLRRMPYISPAPPGPPPGSVQPRFHPASPMYMPEFPGANILRRHQTVRAYDDKYYQDTDLDTDNNGKPDIIITYLVCRCMKSYMMMPMPFAIYDMRTGKMLVDYNMDGEVDEVIYTDYHRATIKDIIPPCPNTCL